MGNSTLDKIRKEFSKTHFEWIEVMISPYCTKVEDRITRIRAEKYKIHLKELEQYFKDFAIRHQHQ